MTEITSLRDETRTLFKNRHRKLTLDKVSKDLGVSTAWLVRFNAGKIPNPGVNTIETLRAYLIQHKNEQ